MPEPHGFAVRISAVRQRAVDRSQAFARPSRHNAHHIFAAQNILDDFSLMRTKVRETEDSVQKIVNVVHKNGSESTVSRFAASGSGIWSDVTGSLSQLAGAGQSAPGMPAGTTFSSFSGQPLLNDSGLIEFHARVSGSTISTTNDTGIWVK